MLSPNLDSKSNLRAGIRQWTQSNRWTRKSFVFRKLNFLFSLLLSAIFEKQQRWWENLYKESIYHHAWIYFCHRIGNFKTLCFLFSSQHCLARQKAASNIVYLPAHLLFMLMPLGFIRGRETRFDYIHHCSSKPKMLFLKFNYWKKIWKVSGEMKMNFPSNYLENSLKELKEKSFSSLIHFALRRRQKNLNCFISLSFFNVRCSH